MRTLAGCLEPLVSVGVLVAMAFGVGSLFVRSCDSVDTHRKNFYTHREDKDAFEEDFNLWEFRVRDMKVGDVVYTVPWAMEVTTMGKCLLKEKYIASTQPVGTAQLMVEKKEDGFYVSLLRNNYYATADDCGWVTEPKQGYQMFGKVKPPSGNLLPVTHFAFL